ncbi:hypothetical protein EBU71_06115 [bacterium]|nr:hypothetical protein [Candidatus Elulimicrobium humile]
MSTEEVKEQPAASQTASAQAQSTPPEESTDLTINDLNGLKTIIDVATQRGAFKASELEAVGKLYNRLDKFLSAASKGQ